MTTNVKISDMTPGAALAGTEQFEMNQAGTFSTTATAIQTFCAALPAASAFSWAGRVSVTSAATNSVTLTSASATNSVSITIGAANGVTFNGGVTVTSTNLLSTATALTDHAAASVATLTNSPVAGAPTKWIAISDNGVVRYIPTWS